MSTLTAAFEVKTPATLTKRASTVKKHMKWCDVHVVDSASQANGFLPFEEQHVWLYFLPLRQDIARTHKGYTSLSNFLKIVRFARFA